MQNLFTRKLNRFKKLLWGYIFILLLEGELFDVMHFLKTHLNVLVE